MNAFLVMAIKMVACNAVVEILFVDMYDVKGGPRNKGGIHVCLSDPCCRFLPIHVTQSHSQIKYLTINLKCNKSLFFLKSSLGKLRL